jgi:hypothetical protein
MALTAYKCPHCGARLRPPATDLQVTCEYCGTTSTIQRKTGLFRAPPPPSDSALPVAAPWGHSAKLIFVASILGVAMTAFMLFSISGGSVQTSGARSAAADHTRGATYVEGEAVKLWYGSRWYDATIKQVRSGGRYLVSYDGWSDNWDEVVTVERLQKITPPAATEPADQSLLQAEGLVVIEATQDAGAAATEVEDDEADEAERDLAYGEGEAVRVLWRSTWYDGTIKAVRGDGTYLIGYDGYGSNWDEVVDTTRLEKRP